MAENVCPTCGRELTPEVLGGLCPNCVLNQVFAASGIGSVSGSKSVSAAVPAPPAAIPMAAGMPGGLIGRYQLVERIGEGGMGQVWKAEPIEPVRRPVALKIVKPGLDSAEVSVRFEAERQGAQGPGATGRTREMEK